jgi:hypothetical protein
MLRNTLTRFVPAVLGALGSLGAAASAQEVGSQVPNTLLLQDFDQTSATSYGDLFGRAVLLEFFAHW